LLGLAFAAAATSGIGLATGVLLLPEHNPVIAAKQAATLDVLSGGRLTLGIGIGWSAEEFAALGIPFARRGQRTAEYVAAMRELRATDVSSFGGHFTHFDGVRVYPKPARGRRIPVVVGGNSDAALNRVAGWGDGWYGFNLSPGEAEERVGVLTGLCREKGRNAAGLTEVVLLGVPPDSAPAAMRWVTELAADWGVRRAPVA
jgi:probable F420-dependent oxidoreductase